MQTEKIGCPYEAPHLPIACCELISDKKWFAISLDESQTPVSYIFTIPMETSIPVLREYMYCVFRPANGCSACRSLVEINFLHDFSSFLR